MINRLVHILVVKIYRVKKIFFILKKLFILKWNLTFYHFLEPLSPVAPVHNSKEIPRSYTLKRTDSYDGLGISISASSQTRSNHFIRDVEHGSPGHRAGLRKNDRVISINGVNVENVDFSNVLILIKQGLDNDNLQLSVIHELEQN